MQLKPNTLLQGGKYRIEKVLGQGGFGITYLATQDLLDRKVCIKEFFFKEYCERDEATSHVSLGTQSNHEIVERFLNKFLKEARTISQLEHPNVIKIHDIFKENNTAYYVMDYIEGQSLSDMVKQRGALPESKAVEYIKQIASALDFIHQRSINHLDVKPANIMVRRTDNRAVLIDFGLSKQYDAQGGQTSTTPVGISHGYAPMEQYKQGGVSTFSPETDIYALGATLYKLVTGNTPPQAMDVMNDGLPALPASVSTQVANAIKKAMQPRKVDRPKSSKDFLNMLSNTNTYQESSTLKLSDTALNGEKTSIIVSANAKNIVNGHEYVDLGLSVRWATCNIGANFPHEYGNYYAWGETETKDKYIIENCKTIEVVNSSDGFTIKDKRTDFNDTAQVNLGSSWRMPTMAEFEDLKNKCTWIWTTLSGINGYRVTGPNGNSIFLPAAGYINELSHNEVDNMGAYLSSTPCGIDDDRSYNFIFFEGEYLSTEKFARYAGFTVRPVYQPKPTLNNHEFVDLGLSVKWATCNLGADLPHENGYYYSWGETTTKMEYAEDNCESLGKRMFDISGNINYDAAAANWGENWRIPTIAELVELVKKCTCSIIKQNGVNGCKFTGPNGKSIFLPASGVCDMTSCELVGESGVYWGASPCDSDDNKEAYSLMFAGGGGLNKVGRSIGLTIRPVYQQKQMIDGHEYVDLGLSVKWATCNIGANAPYEIGNLYAWGEASTKKQYTIENCKTIEVQKIEKKSFFRTKTQEIIVDKKENFIDTARANWGSNWRMPTQFEMEELANKCTWEKTKINEKSVYKVTGPNGNSIFIRDPETCIQDQHGFVGSVHCFWSSTPCKNDAYYFFFFSNYHYISSDSRYKERAVRPVSD